MLVPGAKPRRAAKLAPKVLPQQTCSKSNILFHHRENMDGMKDQGQMNDTKGKVPMNGNKDNIKGKKIVKGTKGKGRKRPRSPTPIEEQPLGVEVAQPPTKKQNDVQTAKSNSLMIPVDETCPLAGKVSDHNPFLVARNHHDQRQQGIITFSLARME